MGRSFIAILMLFIVIATAVAVAVGQNREVVLAEYGTSLLGRTPNQVANMRRAVAALDGVTAAPGTTLSLARVLGPISSAGGYVPALAIRDGEATREDGGGICQVASTLYNAALRADFEVIERRRHLWPVHSVPPGLDAAFASGHIDLKLKNRLDQTIRVRTAMTASRLTFRLLGETPLDRRVRVERRVKAILPPEEVLRATDRLRRGERRVAQRGRPGWEVEAWRIVSRDGRTLRRERLSADRYAPLHRVIVLGVR